MSLLLLLYCKLCNTSDGTEIFGSSCPKIQNRDSGRVLPGSRVISFISKLWVVPRYLVVAPFILVSGQHEQRKQPEIRRAWSNNPKVSEQPASNADLSSTLERSQIRRHRQITCSYSQSGTCLALLCIARWVQPSLGRSPIFIQFCVRTWTGEIRTQDFLLRRLRGYLLDHRVTAH